MKYFIVALLLVLLVSLSAPLVLAQTTGSVKGVCKDVEGKPITQAEGEWLGTETGHKYNIKTNNKGEYFSLGIAPGKYNVTLRTDGKEIFHINGVSVGVDESTLDFDLKKEQARAAQGQGLTPEQLKAQQEAAAKAEKEKNTVGSLNEKLNAAKAASDAGDFETAITTLTAANQIDPARDLIWFKLGDAYRMSAPKQTDPADTQKRLNSAVDAYQKALQLKLAIANDKDPNKTKTLAAYYNNLAEAYSRDGKIDDSIKTYEQAAQADPSSAAQYYFNEGAVLTNSGKADQAVTAFDKCIAADPTRAEAYYQKGVNLLGKATLQGEKIVAVPGTAEAFQKYLELQPTGGHSEEAKAMLASIGSPVETGFGTKKKTPPKKT